MPARDVVVLLPGWGTSLDRLAPLTDVATAAGFAVQPLAYEPEGTIEDLADRFAVALRPARDGRGLHLVGHSLGGLVVAAAALGPLAGDAVRSVTTLNAPWRGTWLGYTGRGTLADSLRYGRGALRELRADLEAHLEHAEGPGWLAVGTAGDLGVSLRSAHGTGTERGRLRRATVWATGHSVSLLHRRLHDPVRSHLLEHRTDHRK